MPGLEEREVITVTYRFYFIIKNYPLIGPSPERAKPHWR
jgi:hypothetical protein